LRRLKSMKCEYCGEIMVPVNIDMGNGHYVKFWMCGCQSGYEMPDDERNKIWTEERKEHGFDSRETWSLHTVISDFILPRLIMFKRCKLGYPSELTKEEWDTILDKMIKAFAISSLIYEPNVADEYNIYTEEGFKNFEEGMELFKEYFLDLWW